MKRTSVLVSCLAFTLISFSASLAVELTDVGKVPAGFASEVEKEGKKEIVFGTGATAYEPKILNQILAGYR